MEPINLPTLPPEPPADAPPADRWRWFEAAQREAHIRATVQLAEVQEAARLVAVEQVAQAKRMADLLAQTPPADNGRALTVIAALMAETGKPAAEVLASVQGRIEAGTTLLGA